MSASEHDPAAETTSADAGPKQAGDPGNARVKPSLRPAGIAIVVAVIITAVAQYFAPQFDHQNANLIGLAALTIAMLVFLFCLQRIGGWHGSPWAVPMGTVAAIVLFNIAFQFEGFSGEMLPRFSFRFGNQVEHELKSVVDNNVTESTAEATVEPSEDDSPQSVQFLGPNRNGVYPSRHFAVPRSPSEVRVVWDHGIGEGWSSFAVAGDHAITLEQRGDEECLTCYRLSDGELLWIQRHPGRHENGLGGIGPRSTPTIVGDKVYATTATGFLWCVDRTQGEVVWSVNLLELAGWNQTVFEQSAPWGFAGSPLLVDGLCVVPLGGPGEGAPPPSLVALDAQSGEVKWKSGADQLSYASPIVATLDGQRQIVSVNEKSVSGHQIENGDLLWSFHWPGSTNTGANCSSAVPVGDNRLLVGKGYGGGSALVAISKDESGWKTEDIWRSSRVLKTKFNHTCVDGNTGYGISNGSLQAVNLDDATTYWTQPRHKRAAQGQVVLAEDVLVIQDEEGDVAFIDANVDDYNELFRMPALHSKTWNIPTVAGRYLLVRNDRQAICYELPEK